MNVRACTAALSLFVVAAVACDDKHGGASLSGPSTSSTSSGSSATPAVTSAIATSERPPSAAPSAPVKTPDAIAAQHVLVAYRGAKGAPKSVTRSKADAKKRAEEVATKAKAGADFSALVAEYSDDEGTKARLGSVGKLTRDKMVKPFADAAFALAVDETSAPVETEFGFHVIKRNQ